MIEIPLTNSPEQLFNIRIDGTRYDMRVIYNSRVDLWSLSIVSTTLNLEINGIGLTGGVDIFAQYPALPIKNAIVVNLDNTSEDPTFDNLGTISKLVILTEEELEDGETV